MNKPTPKIYRTFNFYIQRSAH